MGSVVSAIGGIGSGYAQQAASKERALELRQQADMVRNQAKEQSSARLTELSQAVGAINAVAGSRGLQSGSPSTQAFIGDQKKIANTDVQNLGLNAAIQAGLLREGANASISAGNSAVTNSWFSAIGGLENSAASLLTLGF